MLKIKNLQAGYDDKKILNGINIEVRPGEIVALIGPNGSGKSTLLKSIFNLTTINNGQIIYQDKNIINLPTYELIELGISFVPQGRQIFSDLTIGENLEIGTFNIRDEKVADLALKNIYNQEPLFYKRRKELAGSLSGGQQQLLALTRALIQSSRLLLLDEPSLGLSPKVMKEVFEKIIEINKTGTGILLVEQNAKQAVSIAHRTYILENGKVALEGSRDILKNKKIKDIYFGGEISV